MFSTMTAALIAGVTITGGAAVGLTQVDHAVEAAHSGALLVNSTALRDEVNKACAMNLECPTALTRSGDEIVELPGVHVPTDLTWTYSRADLDHYELSVNSSDTPGTVTLTDASTTALVH